MDERRQSAAISADRSNWYTITVAMIVLVAFNALLIYVQMENYYR